MKGVCIWDPAVAASDCFWAEVDIGGIARANVALWWEADLDQNRWQSQDALSQQGQSLMGDAGWLVPSFIVALLNPIVAMSGLASGWLARSPWQTVLGLIAAPLAWSVYEGFAIREAHASAPVALLSACGVIWAALAFAAKRALIA
jgi:hypothetical protein